MTKFNDIDLSTLGNNPIRVLDSSTGRPLAIIGYNGKDVSFMSCDANGDPKQTFSVRPGDGRFRTECARHSSHGMIVTEADGHQVNTKIWAYDPAGDIMVLNDDGSPTSTGTSQDYSLPALKSNGTPASAPVNEALLRIAKADGLPWVPPPAIVDHFESAYAQGGLEAAVRAMEMSNALAALLSKRSLGSLPVSVIEALMQMGLSPSDISSMAMPGMGGSMPGAASGDGGGMSNELGDPFSGGAPKVLFSGTKEELLASLDRLMGYAKAKAEHDHRKN